MTSPNHPRQRTRPLRTLLLMLAGSGLVPLLMVMGWGLTHLVEERNRDAERSVLDLSRALATAVDAELRSTTALLEHMGTLDELERADLRVFHETAERTATQLGWRRVVLSDGEGRILLRSDQRYGAIDPTPIEPKSLARVIATLAPAVGQVLETPSYPSDTFTVRVPVIRSGKLVYVLTAVLPTDRVNAVLTHQRIPSGSIASVFDQVGHRVARSRPLPSPYPTPSLKVLLARGDAQGVGRAATPDGDENYIGYTRLEDWDWVVVVGFSVASVNQGLYKLLRAVAAGLVASLALSVLLAWAVSRRVLRPIEALKEGAAALGRGAPVQLPRLDIAELDDVAVALTTAAADRERAASQVNVALRVAEDANRSKDQFLAMLGHELRNPLAPIATAVELMALKGDERTVDERRVIERQLVHVTRLVDDLLDVSRITSGRLAIRREPIRLADLLVQVTETIRPSLHRRSLALELSPEMDEAWVIGDEVRLVQVFNNLLVNAIKFTSSGGSIRVKAVASGRQARVDVEDTGVGISPQDLERVFDLFYQGPQSPDRARGGLGLGLPIVRSLVGMHGGEVHAASDGPGRGSCFTVLLPLSEPPAAGHDRARASPATGAGKVLVVDDNEDAADTCAALLELSGYTVRVAYTPEAALETLREFTPDVAILDIGLPGMSGFELAGRMKREGGYRGRLVALTGYGQAADMAASRIAGFDAHLTKPVSPGHLLELVEKFAVSFSADNPS